MREDGLVTVERNSKGRRLVNIMLTDKGREALSRATPVAREVVNQVMFSVGEGDAVRLERSLRLLRQNAHYGLEHVAKGSQPQLG